MITAYRERLRLGKEYSKQLKETKGDDMSPIEGLSDVVRIPRLGKIHLGVKKVSEKSGREYPEKTEYFVLPKDNMYYKQLVDLFGLEPKELRVLIPVEDEEVFASQYYRCYSRSRGLVCRGNGITAMRMCTKGTTAMADVGSKEVEMRQVECKGRECSDYKVRCKAIMNLQFLIPEVPGLGIWQIDTGSINSIININSAIRLIKSIYRQISFIPLLLTLESADGKDDAGKKTTIYVLNLRVNQTLKDLALDTRQANKLLALAPAIPDDEPALDSPDWEPSYGDTPPDTHTPQENIDGLWPQEPKGNSVIDVTTSVPNKESIESKPIEPRFKRDPATIKTKGDLYNACIADWPNEFKTKQDILRELNRSEFDITIPSDDYINIASVRTF